MPIYRLTAPDGTAALSTIGNHREGSRCRVILGVGYTVVESVAEYGRRRGYGVETVDEIPAGYATQLARLAAWPAEIALWGRDGADPDSHYRFENTLHANTTRATRSTHQYIDIRDVLDGVVTA